MIFSRRIATISEEVLHQWRVHGSARQSMNHKSSGVLVFQPLLPDNMLCLSQIYYASGRTIQDINRQYIRQTFLPKEHQTMRIVHQYHPTV